MKKLLNSNLLPIIFGIFLFIAMLPYYFGGHVILGGEGDVFVNYSAYLSNFRDAWQNVGTGFPAVSTISSTFPNIFLLTILEKIINDYRIINFILIFLLYYLPFLAIYKVGKELKLSPEYSFLIALFYVVNPFTAYYLTALIQWSLASLFAIPLLFLIILKFYHQNFKLFFFFGLTSLFLAFANTNPPIMVIIQISILISVIIISFYLTGKLNLKSALSKYLIVFSSFITFNLWWILNWFHILSDVTQMYGSGNALSWLDNEKNVLIMQKIFLLKWLVPDSSNFSFLAKFYNLFPVQLVLLIPIVIVILNSFVGKAKKKLFFIVFIFLLITGFLLKGARPPFGEIYVLLVKFVPFFSLFKTSTEKWGVLFIFLFTLLLIFSLKSLKENKNYHLLIKFLILYLIVCSIPFINFNFIPDYNIDGVGLGSRKYKVKDSYRELIDKLNQDQENYRILSLPGSLNYQVAIKNDRDKYYTGLDPIINNSNKPFITSYGSTHLANFDVLFSNISFPKYKELLSLFNIKKILFNKDMYPWFGFANRESIAQLENIFNENFSAERFDSLILYNNDKILPRFYVPNALLYAKNGEINNLPDLIDNFDFTPRTAVFFSGIENQKPNRGQTNQFIFGESDAISNEEIDGSTRGFDTIPYPYVNQRPNSLFYRLVLFREKWEENRLKNNIDKLFEKKLFFAAKRIIEIDKFFSENDPTILTTILSNYQTKMEELISLAKGKDEKNNLAKIKFHLLGHKERIRGMNFSQATNQQIEKVFKRLEEELINAGAYRDFNRITYNFDVPTSGEYEIIVKIDNLQGVSLTTPEDRKIASPSANGDWSNYGKYFFNSGKTNYSLIIPETPNLLEEDKIIKNENIENKNGEISLTFDNSFPSKPYIKDINSLKYYLKSSGGTYFLENSEYTTVHYNIKDYIPNTIYRIQFDYLNDNNSMNVAVVQNSDLSERTGEITPFIQKNLILTKGEFEHEDFLIKSQKNPNNADLYFFIKTEERKMSKALIKNISVKKIFEPTVILKNIKSVNPENQQIPNITFSKINPTKYKVTIKGAKNPYFLIFSESFDKGWKAYIKGNQNHNDNIIASYFNGEIKEEKGQNEFLNWNSLETWNIKPLSEDKHQKANGYANSWFIDPKDSNGEEDYEIIIEFEAQRLFQVGTVFSLVIIALSLLYLNFRYFKARRSH